LLLAGGETTVTLPQAGGNGRGGRSQELALAAALTLAGVEGVTLLAAGTDAPYPGVFQGEGLHRELELLVEAGLQPLQAITLATRNAARLVGGEAQWGTLEPGRRADLLVIDGRPDRRIEDSRRIVMVVQEGRIVDRARLVLDPRRDVEYRPLPGISSQR